MTKRLTILAVAVLTFGCADSEAPAPEAANQNPPVARRFTRDEFKAAMAGKHTAEVRAVLGPPAETYEHGRKTVLTYRGITIDPATGNVDPQVEVCFMDNNAWFVRYAGGPTEDWRTFR